MTFETVPIADVQRYWDARPCNVRHSTRPLGSREYFDEVEARKYRVEPHIPAFADFGRWAGARVLEVGCGIGTDTVNFARAGARVTAVDLSGESLALARRRAEVMGVADRIEFVQCDAEHVGEALAGHQFDLVYSFGVIHHTPHPGRVLDGVRPLVAPGGELRVMVYNRRSWKVLWIVARYGQGRFWRARQLVARHSEAQTGCPVTYAYTVREASDLLGSRGFRVRSAAVDHIFPFRIRDYRRHREVKVWYFRILPQAVFDRLQRRLGWHLMLTAEPCRPEEVAP